MDEKLKDMIKGKFDNKCCRCGASNKLHIHHINYGSDTLDNFLLVCPKCHKNIHKRKTGDLKKSMIALRLNKQDFIKVNRCANNEFMPSAIWVRVQIIKILDLYNNEGKRK